MGRFVEGEDRDQWALLPPRLEDYVGEDNPVLVVDAYVEALDLAALGFERAQPKATGRPGYHPSVLLKIYLYGYLNRIQSSRRLERKANRNVELMWLTGRLAPDFKTIAEGLVGGDSFGVDASLISADACRFEKIEPDEWAPERITRATQEYLDTLDDAAFGAATPVKPKALSPSDPAARFTAANGDRPFYAYCTNYLVDLDHAIIVDVEATAPIRQAEAGAAMDMIYLTRDRFGLYPEKLVADTAYGSASPPRRSTPFRPTSSYVRACRRRCSSPPTPER